MGSTGYKPTNFINLKMIVKSTPLTIFQNGLAVGISYKGSNILNIKELMREWTLSFEIPNTESIQPYCINGNLVYDGWQQYDIMRTTVDDGGTNTTHCECEHVIGRLSNYNLSVGYSHTGNLTAIFNNILTTSGIPNFSCFDTTGSGSKTFTVGTSPITVRQALNQLAALFGVEYDINNGNSFIINFCNQVGFNNSKVFKKGRDLVRCQYASDSTATPVAESYTLEIINLQRTDAGLLSDEFDVGDTVGIDTPLINVPSIRIISYTYCYDDPTKDEITVGSFVPDASDTTVKLQGG